MLKQRILVLSATPWSLIDEVTKQPKSGVSVHYILDNAEMSDKLKGSKPAKGSISLEQYNALPNLPAYLDGEFTFKNKSGNMTLDLHKVCGKHIPLEFA